MSSHKDETELDTPESDEMSESESESEDSADEAQPVEVAKTNLTKRRIIDNLLEERRLSKEMAEYDFDL
ncbi:MAG: PA3496 family putative envelope integrity protein [Pseudomonas sp.]